MSGLDIYQPLKNSASAFDLALHLDDLKLLNAIKKGLGSSGFKKEVLSEALLNAIVNGSKTEIFDFLIENGADINYSNDLMTPLNLSAHIGSLSLNYFIERGAQLDPKNPKDIEVYKAYMKVINKRNFN